MMMDGMTSGMMWAWAVLVAAIIVLILAAAALMQIFALLMLGEAENKRFAIAALATIAFSRRRQRNWAMRCAVSRTSGLAHHATRSNPIEHDRTKSR